MAYCELHALSHYSFLRSAAAPEALVEQAVTLGYSGLAITDECSVAGVVRAYVAWRALPANVKSTFKLIIGSEFHCEKLGKLVLIAPSRAAYGELCGLITRARQRCEKGHYRITPEDILGLADTELLLLWQPSAQAVVDEFGAALASAFPARGWLLYERLLHADDVQHYQRFQRWQQQLQWSLVAAGNVQLVTPDQKPLHDVLQAVRWRQPVTDIAAKLLPNAENYLRPLALLKQQYPAELLAQTEVIAARCEFSLAELRYEYPPELVPAGMSASDYLRQLTLAGAAQRFPQGIPLGVQAKLQKELRLIAQLKYEYFFLTIHDLVQFAQARGILYQGRGSAANSVVCYCLQITAVNPAQIDVLFERFISAERDEPPDIDVDFEHQRREEVIQYIYTKYGRHRAAIAATVIRYRLRSALRDVGKALGFSEQAIQHYLSGLDRRDREQDWREQLLQQVPGLQQHPQGQWLLTLTEALRGTPRHLSQHVGGFVIAANELSQLVPIENATMPERTVIQWDKDDLEALHLLKVDVLALGMLSALQKMLQLVRQLAPQLPTALRHQANVLRDLADIPSEDPKVYQMLQQGDAIGVFQVESRAQLNMLPRLKPATFYDLVIQIAIVRPGPIQGDMVHPYLRRRAGEELVSYPSAAVKQVLERTLGVPIFQEQVIKLAMVAAGFTGGEADQLRRAMANWRSTGKLKQFERKLTEGMLARGYSPDFAARIYRQICGFGEYGFPESHSASFANLAYASAWFKYHYPAAFYVGLLNSLPMGFYSPSQLIQDAKRHHITVLPVCIQHSQWHHQVLLQHEQPVIRLGLRLVKGLQAQRVQKLLAQRPSQGFVDLPGLSQAGFRADEIEALVAAGACQLLSGNRHQSRWQALSISEAVPAKQQLALFQSDTLVSKQPEVRLPEPHEMEDIRADYQVLGLSLRRHPVAWLREQGHLKGCKLASELALCRHQQLVHVTGLVTCRQRPGTSSGVTFLTLEDETGNMNVVIWLQLARQFRAAYLQAKLLKVSGKVELHRNVVHIIAANLEDVSALLPGIAERSRDFH